MGCSISKLEPGEEPPPGHTPAVRRKIDEITRRRRRRTARKDSIVSTTELLNPDDIDDTVSPTDSLDEKTQRLPPLNESETSAAAAVEDEKEEDDDEKKRIKGGGDSEEKEEEGGELIGKERGRRLVHDDDDDEELPGSPSFRVYFVDDSVKVDDSGKEDYAYMGVICEESLGSKESLDPSTEESESKPAKKTKGGRLKALAKKPISYGFLRRNPCSSSSQEDRRPLSGKAA